MKEIKKLIKCLVVITLLMSLVNLLMEKLSEKKFKPTDNTYSWKHGQINYKKQGKGSPVLILHGLGITDSSNDTIDMQDELSTNHTVYAIDLLGCGESDKPALIYTNFLYVQLINDFIRDVIKEETCLIAFGNSSAFAIMASELNKKGISKLVLCSPDYVVQKGFKSISYLQDFLRKFLLLPIYGTFAFNMYSIYKGFPYIKKGKYLLSSQMAGCVNNISVKNISDLTINSYVFDDYESQFDLSEQINNII